MLTDARHAIRAYLRTPGFTLVALTTLALGIGANAAMFSLAYAVLWRPLPFADTERLVTLSEARTAARTPAYSSLLNIYDWRDQSDAFQSAAAYTDATFNLTGVDPAERLSAIQMSASLLSILEVRPALGRDLTPDDDRLAAAPVVILSHDLWQRRFSADPRAIGRSLTLNGRLFTIVGIMPAGFQFPIQAERIDIWTPIELDDFAQMRLRDGRLLNAIARLKPGVSVDAAQSQLTAIAQRLEREYPATNAGWTAIAVPLHERFTGGYRLALLTLFSAVGFVLLIACANLANLILARYSARQREFAVRTALGAARWRLLRQLIVEHLVLALAGGVLGLIAFAWLRDTVVAMAPGQIAALVTSGVDWQTMMFAMALSCAAALVAGLGPSLYASRPRLESALNDRSTTGGPSRARVRGVLVAVEIALAMVLLTGAGLMVRSLTQLLAVDPGFDPQHVVALGLELPPTGYATASQRAAFYRDVVERAQGIRSVEYGAVAFPLPLGSPVAFPIRLEGQTDGARIGAQYFSVSPDYFQTLRIGLRRGRLFTRDDRPSSQAVVIVNEAMVRRFWPDRDPLGQRFTVIDRNDADRATLRTVVGVVGDVRHPSLDRPAPPQMYVPFEQAPSQWAALVVRATLASDLNAQLAEAVRSVDRQVPVDRLSLLTARVAETLVPRRFIALLLGGFAAMAALLTIVGIGGVSAYTVAQRTPEIGVRLALGAGRRDVLRLVLGGTVTYALAGSLAGCLGAIAATRVLRTVLFGVTPLDPVTFVAAAVSVLLLVVVAVIVPARRAMSVNPLVALRGQA